MKDNGMNITKEAAMAKLVASETATYCSHQAIQVSFMLGDFNKHGETSGIRDSNILQPSGHSGEFYVRGFY